MKNKEYLPKTELAKTTFKLDEALAYFNDIAGELLRIELESEKGLARALQCMEELTNARTELQVSMVSLGAVLTRTREENENTENKIAELIPKIQERKLVEDNMLERFNFLGKAVNAVNNTVTEFKNQTSKTLTEEDRLSIQKHIPEVSVQLGTLVEEAARLVEEARKTNLKTLEKNADAMRKSLASARNRLDLICPSQQNHSEAVR